jgi:hypothetical protein
MTTVAGLTVLAGAVSYRHMLTLAQRSGQHGVDAHAFPLTVDGLDLIGVLVLLADRRTGRPSGWLPWTVLTVGTLASITANVAVAPANPVAQAISGWSAVALLAAAKMLAHLLEPAPPPRGTPGPTPALPRPHTSAHRRPDRPDVATLQPPTGPATPVGVHPDDPPVPQDAAPPGVHTGAGAAPRRLPSSEAALTRWRHIWAATCHLDHATPDTAAAHGVSLRTLQFIRAAGHAGHLQAPAPPVATAARPPAATAPSTPVELVALP